MSLLTAASPTITHSIGDNPFEFPKLSYRDKQTILRNAARLRKESLAENRRLAGLMPDAGLVAEFKAIDAQLAGDDAFVSVVNDRGGIESVLAVILKKIHADATDDQIADTIEGMPPVDRFEIVLKCANLQRRTKDESDGEEGDDPVPLPVANGTSSAGS